MLPFVESLHYIIAMYNSSARAATIFRDEDVMLPNSFEFVHVLEPQDIYNRLQANIERYESLPKPESGALHK